jgi:hypothetical protein
MPGGYSITIEIDPELEKFGKKLSEAGNNFNDLAYVDMRMAAEDMKLGWIEVGAIDTGFYIGNIEAEVRPIASVLQARAYTEVKSPAGFPYPKALEESTRYHYRATMRKGQETASQISKMFKELRPKLEKRIDAAIDNIFDWLKKA